MAFYSREQLDKMGFKYLGKDVLISDKSSIHNIKNISIGDYSRIDDFTILSAGDGGIEIGRYIHVACFTSLIGKGKITLKDFSNISSRVAIYSSNDDYSGAFMTNPCVPTHLTNVSHADVVIGKHVIIGSGSVILPGVTLDDGCSVGAMSLVNKSVDSLNVVVGIPAKVKGIRNKNMMELEKNL